MSTVISQLGPNSYTIQYSDTTTLALADAIREVLPMAGWQIHDDNAGSGVNVTYKAPMEDDPTVFKYVNVRLDSAGYLMTEVWEDWFEESHTGLNLAFNSNVTTHNQAINLASYETLFIFANERYLMFWRRDFNTTFNHTTGPSGCIEVTKDNPQEVTGQFPRYIFTNCNWLLGNNQLYVMAGQASFQPVLAYAYECCAALPRNAINALTGEAGAYRNLSISAGGARTLGLQQQQVSIIDGYNMNNLGNTIVFAQAFKNMNFSIFGRLPVRNPWDSNQRVAWTPRLVDSTAATQHTRGKLFGIKFVGEQGASMDEILLPVNDRLLLDNIGTSTPHWIVRTNHTANKFALPR